MGIYRATVTATLRDGSGRRGEDAVHGTGHLDQCRCLRFMVDTVHNSIKHLGAYKMPGVSTDHRRVACLQPRGLDAVSTSSLAYDDSVSGRGFESSRRRAASCVSDILPSTHAMTPEYEGDARS